MVRSLQRLCRQQAVFVRIESDFTLAAILRTLDLSADLETGRCWFLSAGDEQDQMLQILRRMPGLLAPTILLLIPGILPAEVSNIREICERVGNEITVERNARIATIRQSWSVHPPTDENDVRLGLLALDSEPGILEAAREFEVKAGASGIALNVFIADSPTRVGPLLHIERLSDARINRLVCVGNGLDRVSPPQGMVNAVWHVTAPLTIPKVEFHLPCSPAVHAALRLAGIPEAAMVDFFWMCDTDEQPRLDRSGSVLIAEDLPDITADGAGVSQATHRLLWESILNVLRNELRAGRLSPPDGLLIAAEKLTGIRLQDSSLRVAFLDLIRSRAIPGVTLETIARTLTDAELPFCAIGAGWDRLPDLRSQPAPDSPGAMIVTTASDAWTRDVAARAGRGLPIVLFETHPGSARAQLDGILEIGKHYDLIRAVSDLPRVIESLREDEAVYRRRSERLRTHMHTHHAWPQRLAQLSARLSKPA